MKYGPCSAYFTMIEWANQFDVPIFLHEATRKWVMRPDPRIIFWSAETYSLSHDITFVRLGGHFSGSTVLHWKGGAEGKGVLLTGDTITVVADRKWVSFMYSFPNLIPLPAAEVRRIRDTIAPYAFERLYGGWFDAVVASNAHHAVLASANRYMQALEHRLT
jgi:glyoxylase-like metal-dependent hydrolase (beta-lactamase superfamily II)